MKPELDKKLCEKYPKIFAQRGLPMTETCMCWGFDCGDGWYWLIDNLCHAIQSYVDSRNEMIRIRTEIDDSALKPGLREPKLQVEATQVKEKFGALRFYISGGDDTIDGMIDLAEHMSWNICEYCGSTENIIHTKGWITTLCAECSEKREKERAK
jgi:hypothetical protein